MSLMDLLQDQNIPHRSAGEHHHCRPGWLNLDCPHCSRGWGHFRLGWNLAGGYFSCWSCGKVRTGETLADVLGISLPEALRILKQIPRSREAARPELRGKLKLPSNLGPLLPVHRRYLESRGFDPEELEKVWGVKGIGLHPRLAFRLFVPIVWRGEVVSWTCRATGESGKRYINARPEQERVSMKSVLFGGDLARHAAVICEGPFDAMRVGPGAVAVMGVAYTREQVALLARFPVRVICFDTDEEGRRGTSRLADELSCHPGSTRIVELDAPDPGSASSREIELLRREFL